MAWWEEDDFPDDEVMTDKKAVVQASDVAKSEVS